MPEFVGNVSLLILINVLFVLESWHFISVILFTFHCLFRKCNIGTLPRGHGYSTIQYWQQKRESQLVSQGSLGRLCYVRQWSRFACWCAAFVCVQGLDTDHLVIESIQVNAAPKMRRRTYRAHGRINRMYFMCFYLLYLLLVCLSNRSGSVWCLSCLDTQFLEVFTSPKIKIFDPYQ